MVQIDITQLLSECNEWREHLRRYKEEISGFQNQLREIAGKSLDKEQLQRLEHFHNQFHIQLINIHDLKQAIKSHDRKMQFEKSAFNGYVNEESLLRHESLLDQFKTLEHTLQDLREEFEEFLKIV
ncbi:MAG: hypothetical protein N2747_10910 [Chitinophagaceae bacterium]|nr:hypothetical protein [Chitinophagaceae bacterium]